MRWHDATAVLVESGVRTFLDSPGAVLTALPRGSFADVEARSLDDTPLATARVLAWRAV